MSAKLRDQSDPAAEAAGKKRLGIWLFIPLFTTTLVLYFFAMQWRENLAITKVAVEGARILTAKDVVAVAEIDPSSFMFRGDLYDAQVKLLAQPFIKEAVVNRQLPHTLKIAVKEREPIASLAGNVMRYLDSEGVLLPRVESTAQFDLPLISGIGGLDSAAYGTVVNDSDLVQALEVVRASQSVGFYHAISEVHVNPGADILLYSTDGGVPVILGRGDVQKKMTLLQAFWTGFMKPDSLARLQYIDARFDGQIVVKRGHADAPHPKNVKM